MIKSDHLTREPGRGPAPGGGVGATLHDSDVAEEPIR